MNPFLASLTPSIHKTSTVSVSDSMGGGALYDVYSYISAGMGAVYEGIVDRVEEIAWEFGYPGMGRQAVSVILGAVSMLLFTLAFSRIWNRFMAGSRAAQPQQHHEPGNLKRQEESLRSRNEANERAAGLAQKIEVLEQAWDEADKKREEGEKVILSLQEKNAHLEQENMRLKQEWEEALWEWEDTRGQISSYLKKSGESEEGKKVILLLQEKNKRLKQKNTRLNAELDDLRTMRIKRLTAAKLEALQQNPDEINHKKMILS